MRNKFECSKFEYLSLFVVFEPLDFEFVSGFDIWISDFPMPQNCLVAATPG